MMNTTETAPDHREPDMTIVVTCYNEENYISDTLDNVSGALQDAGLHFEIVIVDDVSKDGSVKRIREYIRQHPEFSMTLKVNENNRGLANNYIDAAFIGRGKYYRLCCGDNAEPREVLAALFRHVGKADMIIPCQNQNEVTGKSMTRRCLSKMFTFLVNLASGYRIHYYNGLAIHLRYNVMRWHPNSYGFGFQADMVTRLLDQGASFMQVPSTSIDRKGGASSALTLRNFLSVAHTLLEISFRRLRRLLYGSTMPKPVEVHLKAVK